MFKVKWYAQGKDRNGKDIDIDVETQAKIMERMTKQLKRDKMQVVDGTDDGFVCYDSIKTAGIKAIKGVSNKVQKAETVQPEVKHDIKPITAECIAVTTKAGAMNKIVITIDGKSQEFELDPKTFSTGSTGFYTCGKLRVNDCTKYQLNLNAVLIGSKPKAA